MQNYKIIYIYYIIECEMAKYMVKLFYFERLNDYFVVGIADVVGNNT